MTVDGELFVEPAELNLSNFLSIKPAKYRFPVQLKKRISFSLQLTNQTDEYVAFNVQGTNGNGKIYRANPNRGIVLPGTTCHIEVNLTAKEAPRDMHFEDALLLQSFIAPKGATREDITPEMFEDESGEVVEEFELRVIYVPADPLIPEGSEEGSSHRAYGVDNGNQKLYMTDLLHSLLPKSSREGSSARAFGMKNGNQNIYLLDPVTGDGLRQRNLQKRSLMA